MFVTFHDSTPTVAFFVRGIANPWMCGVLSAQAWHWLKLMTQSQEQMGLVPLGRRIQNQLLSLVHDPRIWFRFPVSFVLDSFYQDSMARRVYGPSRSRSCDRGRLWINSISGLSDHQRISGSGPTGGGLRGWSDSEDDGKYQLKAPQKASCSGERAALY